MLATYPLPLTPIPLVCTTDLTFSYLLQVALLSWNPQPCCVGMAEAGQRGAWLAAPLFPPPTSTPFIHWCRWGLPEGKCGANPTPFGPNRRLADSLPPNTPVLPPAPAIVAYYMHPHSTHIVLTIYILILTCRRHNLVIAMRFNDVKVHRDVSLL